MSRFNIYKTFILNVNDEFREKFEIGVNIWFNLIYITFTRFIFQFTNVRQYICFLFILIYFNYYKE